MHVNIIRIKSNALYYVRSYSYMGQETMHMYTMPTLDYKSHYYTDLNVYC